MDDRRELIALMQDAFETEYNDVFLYLREADLFDRKIVSGERVSRLFGKFSQMELRHADRIASRIIELGGEARWRFRAITVSDSLHEALRNHLEFESRAYQLYSRIIEHEHDPDARLILQGIRENEKEHMEMLRHVLMNLDPPSQGTP